MASQSRILLLGLLNHGPKHGYELEREIRSMNARLWANLGRSTIYHTLKQLENDDAVSARLEETGKGPNRRIFSITSKGIALLEKEIVKALASPRPPVSDRIVGAVFAQGLPTESVRHALEAALADVRHRDEQLGILEAAAVNNDTGRILVGMYRDFYAAEARALDALAPDKGT